jgi:formate C-acetyltransferase
MPLSDRIQKLRDRTIHYQEYQKPYIGQRIYGALEGLITTHVDMAWMRKRAIILASILKHHTPYIAPGEILVGYNYYGSDTCFQHELWLGKRTGKIREGFLAYLHQGNLTEDQIEFCMDVTDELDTFQKPVPMTLEQPVRVQRATGEGLLWAYATDENHTILGYEQVLKKGFRGLIQEIDAELSSLDWKDPHNIGKQLLLESAKEVALAACEFGHKYANQARQLAATLAPNSEYDLEDLRTITAVTDRVPESPATTFIEAVQALWFAHIFNTWEDGINANSIGRLDQILYPYYAADVAANRITKEQAFEILACLWLKLYREYDVQQAVLGGVDATGRDATNELTYLMLDVTEALEFVRCLSVRLHKNTPHALLTRALQVVSHGKGIPFFFNDEVLIPALIRAGIAPEHARDYGAIGCVEICIPGRANPHAVSNRINLLKCLELALNQGCTLGTNAQIGPRTKNLPEMQSIEDVFEAYRIQAEYFIDLACYESNRLELQNGPMKPMVYKSLLTEGCIKSGRDFNMGGALYNYHESMSMGIPNVADSLEAIHTLVFDEKRFTLVELVNHLKTNFADEQVRQLIITRAAKYGNDSNRVDQYAAKVFEHFCKYLETQKSVYGGKFIAQPFTFLWLIEAGERTAATPDGRRKGENLAYSLSPMQGRDIEGITAMLNSLAKFPYDLAAGGSSAIIELDPVLFSPQNFEKTVAVIRTAIEKGVGQMQFNVISAETLREAQAHPDRFPHLEVRVSGFSQRFCLLDRKLQDHIIARTKHTN